MGNVIAVPEQVRTSFTGELSRPNTAPAYYSGHPAYLWITVMRPQTTRRPGPA